MSKVSKVDANVQTVIRVHPHLLEIDEVPKISTDKRIQTVLSESPKHNNLFYSLLKYTPYSDIIESNTRIIDIPRKKKLTFHFLPTSSKAEEHIRDLTLADDDGVGYICSDILKRRVTENRIQYFDNETQTDVLVHPHILEQDDLAIVSLNKETQTIPTACIKRYDKSNGSASGRLNV